MASAPRLGAAAGVGVGTVAHRMAPAPRLGATAGVEVGTVAHRWHLRRAWAPLRFDDGTLADARRTRDPVAAAQPTARARHGKASRRSDDGAPLHGLDTLLGELAARCRNTCRVPAGPSAPALSVPTEPAPTRRRAARLIESFPVPGTSES